MRGGDSRSACTRCGGSKARVMVTWLRRRVPCGASTNYDSTNHDSTHYTVRRVDPEERLAVGADDLAEGGDARGGVTRGELHLARVVRVEQLQVACDLVRVRVGVRVRERVRVRVRVRGKG